MAEINVGLVALSMPVVSAQFIGRLTEIGKSLSSWIRSRRTPQHSQAGDGESSSNLTPGTHTTPPTPAGAAASPSDQQQLPQVPSATLSGMRKFIRNLQRSRVATSSSTTAPATSFTGHDYDDDNDTSATTKHVRTTTTTTFNDLTSADFSYHVQLKNIRANQTTKGGERGSSGNVGLRNNPRREYEA